MKAIILSGGLGSRLRPFTNDNPKCMAQLNGKTILQHELDNIIHYDILDIILVVGPFENKIKKCIADKYPQLSVTYVKNEKYESTNYIYAMWLTKDLIDDDILLLHGDMVFEKRLLGKLIADKNKTCVLINNKIKPPIKDFKGEIIDGLVKRIGVDIYGENAYFLPPIYKLSKDDYKKWVEGIEKFIEEGNTNVYAENAFNKLQRQFKLHPVYFGEEFCMEVDDMKDLNVAREFFESNL